MRKLGEKWGFVVPLKGHDELGMGRDRKKN